MLHLLPANATQEQLEANYALGMLRKEALTDGAYYKGHCRNATVARWHAASNQFVHWRLKFSEKFLEGIKHPEDERNFDVFIPEKYMTDEEVSNVEAAISEEQLQRFLL